VSAYGGVSALADDAFWLLGAIERRQGRFDAAIATYEAFLALRQTAGSLLGPFRSKRLDDVAYLVGAVHFHDRGDLDAAARAFERLLAEFSSSTWRDDALWALAGVAHLRGDKGGTHAALKRLVSEHADSRFAALARAALDGQGPTLARSPGSINTGLLDPREPGAAL
jgi:tetratricopeptide (TPR) repeat protein